MDADEIEARRRLVLLPAVPSAAGQHFEDDHCANCGDPLTHHRPALYCGPWCSEVAATIRYARGATRDGRYERDPLVRHTIDLRFAFALIGGYASFGRKVDPAVRLEVLERDQVCVECGGPANQVDHVAGNANTADNLQLLCDACHRAKTDESLVEADPESAMLILLTKVARVHPDVPRLRVDDHERWASEQPALQKARDARLAARVAALGLPSTKKRMTHAQRAELLAEVERSGPPTTSSVPPDWDGDFGWEGDLARVFR